MPRPRAIALLTVLVVAPWWLATSHAAWGTVWRSAFLSSVERPLLSLRGLITHTVNLARAPAWPAENARLRRQLLALKHEPIRTEELSQEVGRLRRLLQLKQDEARVAVAAHIIGREAAPWFRTLLVDVGSGAGVTEGNAVVVEGGLVGQVSEVGSSVARVLLLTDPRCRVAALVQRSRAQGMVVGTVRGRCYLVYITSADGVQVGDVVLTSGLGGSVPKGLVIGRVVRVEPDPSGLYWQAQVTLAIDPTWLEEVLCLR